MKNLFRGLALLSFLILIPVLPLQAGEPMVQWFPGEFTKALELASQKKLQVFAVFHAEWCGPCKELLGTTLHDPELVKYINEYAVAIAIDVDKNPKLKKQYKVFGYPTILVLRPSGEMVDQLQHYPADQIKKELQSAIETGKTLKELLDALGGDPTNPELKLSLFYKYTKLSEIDEALKFKSALETEHSTFYQQAKPKLLYTLGRACFFEERHAEAIRFFREVIAEGAGDYVRMSYSWLAICYRTIGQMEAAFQIYEEAIGKYPTTSEYYLGYLILAATANAHLDKGIEYGHKAIVFAFDKEEGAYIRYRMAVVYKMQNRIADARTVILEAIALDPQEEYKEFLKNLPGVISPESNW